MSEVVAEMRLHAERAARQSFPEPSVDMARWADALEVTERRVAELEAAIARHRDQKGDDRCWRDDLRLYQAIGDSGYNGQLPPECEFLESCKRFWMQRQTLMDKSATPGMTIAQLEAENQRLREALLDIKDCSDDEDAVEVATIAMAPPSPDDTADYPGEVKP